MKTASVSREGLSAREPECLSGGMRICSGRKCHDQLSSENQLVHLEDIQKGDQLRQNSHKIAHSLTDSTNI